MVVKRWLSTDKGSEVQEKEFLQTSQSNLTSYSNSRNGERPYIALEYTKYENERLVIVGENKDSTTRRRKRESDGKYSNAPLEEDTEYAIFVRVSYDYQRVSFILCSFNAVFALHILKF